MIFKIQHLYTRVCCEAEAQGHPRSWREERRDKSVSVLDTKYWAAAGTDQTLTGDREQTLCDCDGLYHQKSNREAGFTQREIIAISDSHRAS